MLSNSILDNQKIDVSCLRILQPVQLFQEALQDQFSTRYFQKNIHCFSSPLFIFQISCNNSSSTLFKEKKQLIEYFEKAQINSALKLESRQKLKNIENLTLENQSVIFQQLCKQAITSDKNNELLFFLRSSGSYGTFVMGKRSGGRFKQATCCKMGQIFKFWKNRKVTIFNKGISYYNEKGQLRQFLQFSQNFYFQFGLKATMMQFGIILHTTNRRLTLQAKNMRQFILFLFILRKASSDSCYMSLNRFNSFAPLRSKNTAKFLIDGQQFFQAMAQSLQNATSSILMTGWMISPQFLLKRHENKVSLYDILNKAGQKGVKTKIIVYYQSCFLTNDSLYTQQKLQSITGVKILRHPCGKMPVLWSHHGKLVIIDDKQAFVGGFDLCYGRYDNISHQLFPKQQLYPGLQHNNIRKDDQIKVRQPTISNIPRQQCRLPWHDIGSNLKGDVVVDLVHHFYQMWNFVRYQNKLEPSIQSYGPLLLQKSQPSKVFTSKVLPGQQEQQKTVGFFKQIGNKFENIKNNGLSVLKRKSQVAANKIKKTFDKFSKQTEDSEQKSTNIRPSIVKQDYFQTYLQQVSKQIKNKQQAEQKINMKMKQQNSIMNQSKEQRRKNRKLSSLKVKELKQVLSQQQNQTIVEQRRLSKTNSFILSGDKIMDYMSLQINNDYVQCLKKLKSAQNQLVKQDKNRRMYESMEINSDQQKQQSIRIFNSQIIWEGRDQCQAIRSAGNWSLGLDPQNTQFSIQIAYLQLISQAKNYIYIQNQFFISSIANQKVVHNQIAMAIFLRIKRAIQAQQIFRVYILLPLIPGFAGDLQAQQCLLLRKQMQWQYDTICRGPNSLWQKLLSLTNDPGKYIQFYGLRTHGRFDQNIPPTTQIIYIHSKLMIIDDQIVVCGSANINDRSMLGNRDSQIAVVTRGEDFIEGQMNGSAVVVSQSAFELRVKLWSQHFGMKPEDLKDPCSDQIWERIIQRASNNTSLYRKIFGCYPDDNMKTRAEIIKIKNQSDIGYYEELAPQIIGNIVEFPMRFLEQQPLTMLMTEKQFYMPSECLT